MKKFYNNGSKKKKHSTCLWCNSSISFKTGNYCDTICYRNWSNSQAEITGKKERLVKVNEKTWVAVKDGETDEQAMQRMANKLGQGLTLEGRVASKQTSLGFRNKGLI